MNKLLVMLAALSLTASCNCFKPEKRVHRLLTDRTQTLAVAESCTGGTIAARFTAMPGASAYFKGGVVAYWNQTKELRLIRVRGNRSKVIRKAGSAALSLLEEEMLTEKTARYNP